MSLVRDARVLAVVVVAWVVATVRGLGRPPPCYDHFRSSFPRRIVVPSVVVVMTERSAPEDRRRRSVMTAASSSALGSFFGGLLGGGPDDRASAAASSSRRGDRRSSGPTNEIVETVNGMRRRRLGGSDIVVSELGLGTQRWASADFNAPSEEDCFAFMDEAILKRGVNLLDTAEQYPIPSDPRNGVYEGSTETLIGKWMTSRKVPRRDVVVATKITGGRNVTPENIKKDCVGSLQRLNTDYIDVYQLHWPARYSPQSNWGQSLAYDVAAEEDPYWRRFGGPTSFEDLCGAMDDLVREGKIRGWGLCNDNAYGLTACARVAAASGAVPPCSIQGDFSLIDRKSEENGVAEAASPYNENVGFMAYNALAGGVLTGKYADRPAALDDPDRAAAVASLRDPRGRMDTRGWGGTLYRYRSDAALDAARAYATIAEDNGMTPTELALRWCRQRTLVTTTLVGHSNMDQLRESMTHFSADAKPLSDTVMWEIDRVHMRNRTPIFSSNRVGRDWFGEGEIGERIP